jgi:hypothetical protein
MLPPTVMPWAFARLVPGRRAVGSVERAALHGSYGAHGPAGIPGDDGVLRACVGSAARSVAWLPFALPVAEASSRTVQRDADLSNRTVHWTVLGRMKAVMCEPVRTRFRRVARPSRAGMASANGARKPQSGHESSTRGTPFNANQNNAGGQGASGSRTTQRMREEEP